jgi:hypothetical protein
MKLRAPIHSADARGRLADALVLGFWRGIHWARRLVMPRNPKTPRQEEVRGNLTLVTKTWPRLSDSQRALWEAFALLMSPVDPLTGNQIRWTGIAGFIWTNTVLVDTGQPLALIPPGLPMPQGLPGFALNPGPGPGEARATWTPLPAGVLVDLWTQAELRSRKLHQFRYRHRIYVDGTSGAYTFGGNPTGWKIGVKARQVLPDGGRGTYERGVVIVP